MTRARTASPTLSFRWLASALARPPARPTIADYGVKAARASLSLRSDGVTGRPAVRVALAGQHSQFSFEAANPVYADAVGRTFRIGAWLRTDVAGIVVCLRIEEVAPADSLSPVRVSETCLAPTAHWRRFRIVRRTLARGDTLRFSVYSYGAAAGDSFEIDGFDVARRGGHAWKRVTSAFSVAT